MCYISVTNPRKNVFSLPPIHVQEQKPGCCHQRRAILLVLSWINIGYRYSGGIYMVPPQYHIKSVNLLICGRHSTGKFHPNDSSSNGGSNNGTGIALSGKCMLCSFDSITQRNRSESTSLECNALIVCLVSLWRGYVLLHTQTSYMKMFYVYERWCFTET